MHLTVVTTIFFLSNIPTPGVRAMASMATIEKNCFVGFDLGTSGARISILQNNTPTANSTGYNEVHSDSTPYSHYDDPKSWIDAVHHLLGHAPSSLLARTKSICVSGTSASCLLVDPIGGRVTRGRAKMYDYDITREREGVGGDKALEAMGWIDKHAPPNHPSRAPTSALSKLLHYHACTPITPHREILTHQSEYVATTVFRSSPKKCGAGNAANRRTYTTDWHNALKLGYDVEALRYPEWLTTMLREVGIGDVLPDVVKPGSVIGPVAPELVERYGFGEGVVVVGGTTDSNAAFVAATASGEGLPEYGVAVTSLGSTLAMKMLSRTRVEDSERGVYSHRFPVRRQAEGEGGDEGEAWLVGGASNVGCAVLRREFTDEELLTLSADMDISTNSPYDYYPLTKIGERFPIADGTKEPNLQPRPESRVEYLKGILQGVAHVERTGFEVLGELGADPPFPVEVWTAGGGAKNDSWLGMRERLLRERFGGGVRVRRAENAEASFGAAVLAASTFGVN